MNVFRLINNLTLKNERILFVGAYGAGLFPQLISIITNWNEWELVKNKGIWEINHVHHYQKDRNYFNSHLTWHDCYGKPQRSTIALNVERAIWKWQLEKQERPLVGHFLGLLKETKFNQFDWLTHVVDQKITVKSFNIIMRSLLWDSSFSDVLDTRAICSVLEVYAFQIPVYGYERVFEDTVVKYPVLISTEITQKELKNLYKEFDKMYPYENSQVNLVKFQHGQKHILKSI